MQVRASTAAQSKKDYRRTKRGELRALREGYAARLTAARSQRRALAAELSKSEKVVGRGRCLSRGRVPFNNLNQHYHTQVCGDLQAEGSKLREALGAAKNMKRRAVIRELDDSADREKKRAEARILASRRRAREEIDAIKASTSRVVAEHQDR